MTFRSGNTRRGFAGRTGKRPGGRHHLQLEQLEDRALLSGTPLDLASPGAMGAVNGALFRQATVQPTGTGVINSFVRIQGDGSVEQGYNTDFRAVQFDEKTNAEYTRSLPLDAVPRVNIGGRLYREFLLDVNEKSSAPAVSLDELRLYVGNAPNLTGYDAATGRLAGLAPAYDLDGAGDRWIKLDYRLGSGSGSGDMLAYVPDTAFGPGGPGRYLYLYSKFGVNLASSAGFEEWAVGSFPITPSAGVISGTVYNDLNNSASRQAAEPGLANWVVYLDANDNGVLDAGEVFTRTDANGNYAFTNLATGLGSFSTYRVREVVLEGWVQTTPNPADIVLALSGQTVSGVDFGNFLQPEPPGT